jgi:hypothetical protein
MSRRRMAGPAAARRRAFIGLAAGVTALGLLLAAGAFASTLNEVVPSSGKIAGQPYAYYLQRAWDIYYTAPAPGPSPCQTIKVGGRSVAVVEDIPGGPSTCHEPTHRPIFINEASTACSNIPHHHNGWGTSDSQLQKCSRTVTEKALITEWLDGRRVPNFGKTFWKGVKAFSVTVPPGRFKGFTQGGQAHVAAWGWSLLLKGLPKGTHTVRCKATYPNGKLEFQSRVTLHVG